MQIPQRFVQNDFCVCPKRLRVSGCLRSNSLWFLSISSISVERRQTWCLGPVPNFTDIGTLGRCRLANIKRSLFLCTQKRNLWIAKGFFAVRGSLHSLLDCDCCKACCEFLKFCETCHNQCGLAKLRRFGAVSTKADCMMLYGLLPYRFFRVVCMVLAEIEQLGLVLHNPLLQAQGLLRQRS